MQSVKQQVPGVVTNEFRGSARTKQQGVGLVGWLFLILLIGGAITVGTKLFPAYLDNSTMSNILDKLAEEDGMANRRESDIKNILQNRFKLNNIRHFDLADNVNVEKTKNGTELTLNYEVRVPLIGNIDLIASFNKEIELRN